jgi:transposase
MDCRVSATFSWSIAVRALSEFQGVFIHRDPVDMRKAINGLCEIVAAEGMGELMGPHLFVFCGRRKHTIKILYFDRSGFALWQKRLEKERFQWPKHHESEVVRLTTSQLQWLLEGYDVWKMKPFEELRFSRVS